MTNIITPMINGILSGRIHSGERQGNSVFNATYPLTLIVSPPSWSKQKTHVPSLGTIKE